MRARTLLLPVLLAAGLLLAGAAGAQDLYPAPSPVCEPPVSTCGPALLDGAPGWLPADACPAGSVCTCVPSRPARDDCAAQVCVREPRPDPMCEERRHKALAAVRQVVERFDYCEKTRDCVWIDDGTRCTGSCGAFVNRKRARRAARMIDRIDARICRDFGLGGCPVAIPGCLEQVAACIENRCVGIQRPPPPLPLPVPTPEPFEPRPGAILEFEPSR